MLSRHVALISETPKIDMHELAAVATALQKQVNRDFQPIWGIAATVGVFGRLEDMPLDYWPVLIKETLDRPGAAGYHDDDLGQPCALVGWTKDWSVSVSHETLEMLADPWGRHLVASESPRTPGQRVKFLVEVCDPCSGSVYTVNGIGVSDFYTPHYFDPVKNDSVRYSFTGAIKEPRQLLKGGYLTWYEWEQDQWWHRTWFDGRAPKDQQVPIPKIVQGGNIRAAIDRHVGPKREAARQKLSTQKGSGYHAKPGVAATKRAKHIRTILGM